MKDDDLLRVIAEEIAKTMQCRCDLDNWEPTRETGHSWVCPIHKEAEARWQSGEGRKS